ncbi:hypothetical protein [Methanosarcina mazei]|uniref:DUF2254 domain-containing protein n=1 Tax=Methanosarcina mazei TaxID=2209 RepID=A0A6C0VI14_METMZ|nr:hypothetical protein [Methanosarcina mazei]QIB91001.1 hypothetical protein FQU78_07980 [Methanosarcina mazei]
MLEDIRERICRKIKPDFNNYEIYLIISIFFGIVLKVVTWKHELIDVSISSINHVLNISSNSSIDHRLVSSTCAAILSTVFTIIFVLLTVLIQMSGAHTSAVIFESNETKNLVRLYFVAIIFSLITLETTFQFPIIVLTLTFACILSLYPFLRNISNKFQYKVGVEKLSEEISLLIDANKESLASRKMKLLADTVTRSINDSRQEDFFSILYDIKNLTNKAKNEKMIQVVETVGYNYSTLLYNSINKNSLTKNREKMISSLLSHIDSYIGYYSETISYDSLAYQAHYLTEAGTKMVKVNFGDEHISDVVENIFVIYYSIQKKKNAYYNKKEHSLLESFDIGRVEYKIEPKIIKYIEMLASESLEHKLDITFTTTMEAFFAMGVKAFQVKEKVENSGLLTSDVKVKQLENANQQLKNVVRKLSNIEDKIGSDNFEVKFNKLKNANKCSVIFDFSEFDDYADKFEMYYYSQKELID